MRKVCTSRLKKANYGEIDQYYLTRYAFVEMDDDTVYPLHTYVKCRDFLNDTLVWRDRIAQGHKPQNASIYGYMFKGTPDMVPNALLVTFGANTKEEYFKENLKLLNSLETALGLECTTSESLSIEDDTQLVKCDPKWVQTTVHFSVWTGLLRYLAVKPLTSLEDISKLEVMDSCIMTFRKHGVVNLITKMFEIQPTQVMGAKNEVTMHNHNGFVSWVAGYGYYVYNR